MNKIIAVYPDYDDHRYGTPWAAPCDINGRPNFKGQVGHFTGGKGKGGTLYVTDPKPGSVWAYGVKDYKSTASAKSYVQFRDGKFYPLHGEEVHEALADQEHKKIRTATCIRGLQRILAGFEGSYEKNEVHIAVLEEAIKLLEE